MYVKHGIDLLKNYWLFIKWIKSKFSLVHYSPYFNMAESGLCLMH